MCGQVKVRMLSARRAGGWLPCLAWKSVRASLGISGPSQVGFVSAPPRWMGTLVAQAAGAGMRQWQHCGRRPIPAVPPASAARNRHRPIS